jgi:hypothetical protein
LVRVAVRDKTVLKISHNAIILKLGSSFRKKPYEYLFASLILVIFLLTMNVAIRSQEMSNDNQVGDSQTPGSPNILTVLNEYLEILAVLLEVGIVILLWKTVKVFVELAKVSKLQTQVRFKPWVGLAEDSEFLREDNDKKQ